MWKLYRTATKTSQRPSSLLEVENRWAAYIFDAAVVYFGTQIEAAAAEMVKEGPDDKPRWEPKYSMVELLTDGFTLTIDEDGEEPFDVDQFRGMDGAVVDSVE